ncbi:two-component sensor histidine kinase [Actinoplanes cyaneus]|uniref:histidine kinase n=1 Tax=Actinoplanes cyaneus TaxID=52696 RepID=A0A919ILY0_9ACTN|nr:HAMP domain-containing sensor histidine kinase [Actinoplanes cyaneus]MCW2140053.1 two-component system, OmpR family, sensor histidine kinase BaeS [Actinoplanes cyaneus]GID67647.1 two-component sensor histidine kinase [Actinoplanes cyaneus]
MSRVRLRHSLVTRLLVTSVLIAIAAIAATAWLAASTATRAISQEQGQSLTDDKGVYDMLLGYAATHSDWSGAQALIQARAAKLNRRITLTTVDRAVLADSGPGPSLATARPSATVDPLTVDTALTGGTERIDPRATGPFRVPAAQRAELDKYASDVLVCLRNAGADGRIVNLPNGRPSVTVTGHDPENSAAACPSKLDYAVTKAEAGPLNRLGRLATACAGLDPKFRLGVWPDFSAYYATAVSPAEVQPVTALSTPRVDGCVEKSRRTMLQPYVAPPALLFVTDPRSGADQTRFTLSRANTIRIVTVTGGVLLATILVTVLLGYRLVRPLRALTDAADGHRPVPVTTRDEIGRLARALNDSTSRRDRAEAQRRAMVIDVAHELRTPLTNIRSWLEAAQDDLAPTDSQLLDLLHDEAVQLQHIIDDLTDLAAADAGTLRVHAEPTYVRDVLTPIAESHRVPARAAGVELTIEIDGDPVVSADPVRLRQVVGNLVANGIRYTPAGGSVTVAAAQNRIRVRDTGVGIAPDDLPRIFDRFWRADESRSRATGGSGLGLAIARKLTEAHGGTLTAASAPGHGSTFTIDLPPAHPHPPAPQPQ